MTNFIQYIGMYILHALPQGNIAPQGLVKGSRAHTDRFLAKINSFFRSSPHIVNEWNVGERDIAPKSDDVSCYVIGDALNINNDVS